MEYLCDYCKKPFLPKRTDSLYCSHSCRQLAYVLRKANANTSISESKPLNGLQITKTSEPEKQDPSSENDIANNTIDTYSSIKKEKEQSSGENKQDKLTANEEYPSIIERKDEQSSVIQSQLTDKTKKSTENTISVNTNKENLAPDKTKQAIQKQAEPEFKEYNSRFINELDYLYAERNNWSVLDKFFECKDEAGMWVSERYRCLTECLLLFSETKQIELDDLKELCNAFTCVLQSKYYKCLHPSYPYISEMKELRERIKTICLRAGNNEFIKYKLNKVQKQNMILTRMELSNFVPKIKFSELSFREKEKIRS